MTECERIIKEGILPESFFKEEVKCDFLVDEKRKKLWAVLLDMLCEFDRVCKEYELKYYLAGGTLLGAVRHQGFIPWDDDIDVAMPRQDYERFLKINNDFKHPYLLQTPYTDEGYYYSFAKLRNVNTTFFSKAFIYAPFNQGCFIDIFPYDYFDIEGCDELYNNVRLLARSLSVIMKKSDPTYSNTEMEIENILKKNTPKEIYEQIQSLAVNAGNSKCKYWTSIVSTLERYNKKAYPVKCFNKSVLLPFENYNFPAPSDYETVLTCLYGDYMKLPPINERNIHVNSFFDPDIPYDQMKKQYIKNRNKKE